MARSPRASVSKTSGQGISRLSYQKGYALGNKGAQGGKPPSVGKADTASIKTGRGYGKGEEFGGDMNVSYGDTLALGDIKDVKDFAALKAPKTRSLGPKLPKKLK